MNEEKLEKNTAKLESAADKGKLAQWGITRKSIYSGIAIVGCLFLVIVLSVVGAQFNKELLKSTAYWVSVSILAGLSVFGLVTGQQIGDDSSRNTPEGNFRKTLGNYDIIHDKIDNADGFIYFGGWLENYRERKLEKKCFEIIRDSGYRQREVLDLDPYEVESLKDKPLKKEWEGTPYEIKYKKLGKETTIFMRITEEQAEAIRYAMSGKVKVSKIPEEFFMNALDTKAVDMWESAANASRNKNNFLRINYGYRLFGLVLSSIILNALDPLSKSGGAASVAYNLAVRVFVLLVSVIWGIFLGYALTKIDTIYINYKVSILNLYDKEKEKGIYQYETVEQQAEKEYEEYEKQIEQEEEKNIEIVEENKEQEVEANG